MRTTSWIPVTLTIDGRPRRVGLTRADLDLLGSLPATPAWRIGTRIAVRLEDGHVMPIDAYRLDFHR